MSAARKSGLVDVEVIVRHQTEAAYLVVTEEKQKQGVWVPKALAEIEGGVGTKSCTLTVPEWFAVEKGLV